MEMGIAGGTDGDRPAGCLRWCGTAGGHSRGVDGAELRGPTRSHSDAVPDTGVLEAVGPGILECWEIGVAGDRRPGRDIVPEQRPG